MHCQVLLYFRHGILNPHLGGKPLHVVLLRVERVLSDEDREVCVLDAHRLDVAVEPIVDFLPHGVRPRAQDVAACRRGDSLRVSFQGVGFPGSQVRTGLSERPGG